MKAILPKEYGFKVKGSRTTYWEAFPDTPKYRQAVEVPYKSINIFKTTGVKGTMRTEHGRIVLEITTNNRKLGLNMLVTELMSQCLVSLSAKEKLNLLSTMSGILSQNDPEGGIMYLLGRVIGSNMLSPAPAPTPAQQGNEGRKQARRKEAMDFVKYLVDAGLFRLPDNPSRQHPPGSPAGPEKPSG